MSLVRNLLLGCRRRQCGPVDPAPHLARTLDRARRSEFYSNSWPDDARALAELPLLTKDELRDHADRLLVGDVPNALRRWVTTGGTTGAPVGLWLDRAISLSEWRFMNSQWARAGYRKGAWRAVLRGRVITDEGQGRPWALSRLRRELRVSTFHLTPETLPAYLRQIERVRPQFLHAYPSSAQRLADLCEQTGQPVPQFRALLLGSEAMPDSQREWLVRAYGAPVYTWYGLTEKVLLGGECPFSRAYHLFPGYGWAEIVDQDGVSITEPGVIGRLVGTGFLNWCAPLVRYDTGDLASWGEGPCQCGWRGQLLARVHGRAQEVIELPSGAIVSAAAVNLHTHVLDGIRQLQYAQVAPDRLLLRVVPSNSWSASRERALVKAVKPRVPGMRVSVETVAVLRPGPSGKVPYVVSEL